MSAHALRLYCLPYAGASAMIYARWRRLAPDWLHIVPLELPGRGARAAEPLGTDLRAAAQALAAQLGPGGTDAPYALFGHSLGSLLALEMAHALRGLALREPLALVVSGAEAPAVRNDERYAQAKSDADLMASLRELNGTPEDVLADKELMSMTLPVLRSDFLMCGTYRHLPRPPLDCPIHVLGGLQDRCAPDGLRAWRAETRAACSLQMMDGDHFFIHAREADVVRLIADRLAPALALG